MSYTNDDIHTSDRDALIEMVLDLKERLKTKNLELNSSRKKLTLSRHKILKMKDTIAFQRNRIVELYQDQK